MSLKIKLKQIDGVPTTSDLEDKEIGVDITNSNLYVNLDGVITSVGGGGGGGSQDGFGVSQGSNRTSQVAIDVDFFTAAEGLDTVNTTFKFKSTIDGQYTYTGTKTFTLSNGDTISRDDITLFQF